MSFIKEKNFLFPLTPLSKKQKVVFRHGCLQEERDAGGRERLLCCCIYLQGLWLQCSVMLLWRAVSCGSSPCQQDSSRVAAQGGLAVQGKLILLDGLNRTRACYCAAFPLFSSSSWFSSKITQNFSFLRQIYPGWKLKGQTHSCVIYYRWNQGLAPRAR